MKEANPPGFGPGTRVILAGETLTTDLTGLAIVEDTNFQETVAWARFEAEKLRDEVRQAIHLYPKPEWVLSKL